MSGTAFWIDAEYDRENASDGRSRFGAYIRQSSRVARCWSDDTDDSDLERRLLFAEATWETANSPVMSPGYVRTHPRIRQAVVRDDFEHLGALVELAVPWLAALTRSRDWVGGTYWRDWIREEFVGSEAFFAPEGEEFTRSFLLTTTRLMFPFPNVQLPALPPSHTDATIAAREVVADLVDAMNAVVTPVIATLERS
jgi:hypothetical protein